MGTVVTVLTVLTVGVVKGDAVDSDAVVTVVTSGVLAVVCDSVVNVVGLTVLSVTKRKCMQQSNQSHRNRGFKRLYEPQPGTLKSPECN